MKRKLLLLALCALFGMSQAKAYTTSDLTSAGWTLVTESSGLTSTNYYLFVDAETSAYAMARTTNTRPVFVKMADPFSATHQVWKLEANNGKFYIQSNVDDYYFYSGSGGWNDEMSSSNKTAFTFEYADSKWKINDERSGTEIYVGAWKGLSWLTSKWYQSDDNNNEKSEYQRVVSNKTVSNSGHFLLYSIPRTTFDSKKRTVTTLTNAGWEKVTATSGLAKSDRYYLFLDDAFPCMAMTNTGAARPQFKALGDPTTDKTSLWTTETKDDGYAIMSVANDQYLWTNASWVWECNFDELKDASKYAFTISDGKWKLHSAAIDAKYYQGRFADSNDYPYDTEDIASNKETTGLIQWAIYSIPKYLNDIEGATPVTAGTYFLRTSDGKYMSRGSSYQVRTTADAWGLPITIVREDKGLRLKYADSDLYLYVDGSDNLYTDNNGSSDKSYWALVSTEGGYKLVCTESTVRSKYVVLSNGLFALSSSGDPAVFTLEATASHSAQMTALKNSQAAAVATAVGLEGVTTFDALSTAVSDWNTENISLTVAQSIGERYEGEGKGRAWSENIASETKTLSAGLYRLTVYGYHRMRDNATTYTLHNSGADSYPAVLVAGDQSVQLCSVFDVASDTQWDGSNDYKGANNKYYPNNQTGAGKAFDAGNYLNTLYFYVNSDDTEVTVGIKDYGYCGNSTWTCYRGLTLTRIAKPYEALSAILDTRKVERDAKTWGFEDGEYAPYNSAAMLADIDAADALIAANDLTLAQSTINALTTKLTTTDTWGAANDGEVNAIYNPTFALSTNDMTALGWSSDDGSVIGNESGDYHSRALVGHDNLAALNGTKSALYLRYDGTNSTVNTIYNYGTLTGYTMPLKANTIYCLKADAAVWSTDGTQWNKDLRVAILNSSSVEVGGQTLRTPNSSMGGGSTDKISYEFLFCPSESGDYTLTVDHMAGTSTGIVISNFELKKAASQTLTLPSATPYAAGTYPAVTLNGRTFSADNWNTLCVPFAFSLDDFAAVKELSGITVTTGETDKHISMALTDATSITAGKPYLVKAKSNGYTLTATNVSVGAAVQESSATADGYTVNYVGTFTGESLNAEDNSNAWVVSNNKLFNVASDVPVGAYKGYFTVSTAGSVKALTFDFDGATGVEAIDNGQLTIDNEAGAMFDLSGRRVSKAQKGLYIMNGKKVMVK